MAHRTRTGREPDGDRALPRPVRRVRTRRPRPHVRAAPVRAGRRLDPLGAARLRPRLVRDAGPHLARPRGARRRAPAGAAGHDARGLDDRQRVPQGLGTPADGRPARGRHARVLGAHRLGHRRRPRAPDARAGRVPGRLRRPARPVRAGAGGAAADPVRRRRASRPSSGPRTSTRSGTSTTPPTSTTSRRPCSPPARRRPTPSRRCRARSGSSTSRRRRPARPWHGAVWADPPPAGSGGAAGGWAWRLTDEAGADLARGRLDMTGDAEESSGDEPAPAGSGR